MKFTKVSVTKSIESANKYGLRSWDKISTEIELDDPNDTIEKAYQLGRQFITEKVSELTEKQTGDEPVIQKDKGPLAKFEEDFKFNDVKKKLAEFKFREDAQAYLDTTEYSYTIEAKKIVNNLKNKQ